MRARRRLAAERWLKSRMLSSVCSRFLRTGEAMGGMSSSRDAIIIILDKSSYYQADLYIHNHGSFLIALSRKETIWGYCCCLHNS